MRPVSKLLALVLALALAPFAIGCRTQCMADDDASPDQLAKEKKAALRAQIVCKELQRPTIDAKGERLKLSATRENDVTARSEIPADAPRFEPLFTRLDRYKRHYKQVWPADQWEPFAYVDVDAAFDGAKTKTLVATVVAAGYTTLRLTAGGEKIEIVWGMCGNAMPKDPAPTAADLVHAFTAACRR